MELAPTNPAVLSARTIHTQTVRPVTGRETVLKRCGNTKLGGDKARIKKGIWKGFPIYTLTLQERATCPTSCFRWRSCYGNQMWQAIRYEHGPALEAKIEQELAQLQRRHPRGFAVRIHVLGDFYSAQYVNRWAAWLAQFPALHVWGYTAWLPGSEIGDAIDRLRSSTWPRFAIRFSNGGTLPASANPAELGYEGITCPEQTGRTASCATCGLCWTTLKNINFLKH